MQNYRVRRVLISGAGIAGATLAYWLARRGLSPTIVEQDQAVRSSGSPVDVRGPAIPIVRAMGVLAALRSQATAATGLLIIGSDGRQIARLRGPNSAGTDAGEVEIARADLAGALLDACQDLDLRYDDSIAELAEDRHGVDVAFRSGRQERFALVVGADGAHSATRKLIFGSEEQFVSSLGLYVATTTAGPDIDATHSTDVRLYNSPGRLAAIHPGSRDQILAFIFRRPPSIPFDHRDSDQHRKLIMDTYADDGWLVPDLLERVRHTDDLYVDAVNRIAVPQWSRGRIGLVGDAASSVSLLGDGSTKAIVGAHTLAEELAATDDHRTALRRYQSRHAPMISSARRVRASAALLLPATGAGLAARNVAARVAARIM